MKIVLQRVSQASVAVDGNTIGQISQGYLVLLGIGNTDTPTTVSVAIAKIKKLRLFSDDQGKTNLSIADVAGELLVVSQFTLYADCRKGTRPSFTDSAPPALAEALYEQFIKEATPQFAKVAHGAFGASMEVSLVNSGPFTITLDF